MVDDLLVRVDAQVAGFTGPMAGATKATLQLEAALKRASAQQELYQRQLTTYGAKSAQAQTALARAQMSNARLAEQAAARQKTAFEAQAAAYSKVGRGLVTGSAAIGLALGASAKAAIDWQASWTQVRKALDGSPEQLAAVESGLRGLARELPVTHDQIAEIASSAAQLGVSTGNVVQFTKVVAELGTTSDLVGDEGATALARFLNITRTSQGDVENVASSLTALGQAGASTVNEIVSLGLRLAAAGKQAGLTDGDILGLSNAMSSLGIQAESGGSSVSRTFQSIIKSTKEGGDELDRFAAVAGESSKQFVKDFGQDATGTFVKFLKGLDGIAKSGGDVYGTLADLHITSVRQIDTLTRLAANTDELTKSIDLGNSAYEQNNALAETFGKQAETDASKIRVAENNISDLGISLGNVLLPALGDAAGLLKDFGAGINSLPGPVKEIIVVLGVATATVAGLSGASLLLRSRLIQARLSMQEAGVAGAGLTKGMLAARGGALAAGIALGQLASHAGAARPEVSALSGALTGFALSGGSPWGAAIGGAVGLVTSFADSNKQAAADVDALTQTLDAQTGAITDNSAAFAVNQLDKKGLLDNVNALGLSIGDVTQAMLGNADAAAKVRAQLDALTSLGGSRPGTGGTLDSAREILDLIGSTNTELDDAQTKWRATKDAEDAAKAAVDGVSSSYQHMGGLISDGTSAVAASGKAFDDQKKSVDDAKQALEGYNSAADALLGRQLALAQSIIDARKAMSDQKDGFNKNTTAGQENYQIVRSLAAATQDYSDKTETGRRAIQKAHDWIEKYADAQGKTAAGAKALADRLVPVGDQLDRIGKERPKPKVTVDDGAARNEISDLQSALAALSANKHVVSVVLNIEEAISRVVSQIPGFQHNATGSVSRQAQVTNSPILWGEAGPEAYIPLSNDSRRPRALSLWAQTGQALGVPGMADGDVRGRIVGGTGSGAGSGLTSLAEFMRLVSRPEAVVTLRTVNQLYRERLAEEHDLALAQERLRDVRQDATHTDKELADAEKAVSKARDDERDAMDKWRQAQKALVQQTRETAAQYQQLGSAFGGEGTSLSAQGLLSKKRGASSDAAEFRTDLGILKRKGADRYLMAELRGEGPTQDALTLLRDLIRQPPAYFRQLSGADLSLARNDQRAAAFGVGGSGGSAQTSIGTQIQRQGNVHIGRIEVRDRAGERREIRHAVNQALAIEGST